MASTKIAVCSLSPHFFSTLSYMIFFPVKGFLEKRRSEKDAPTEYSEQFQPVAKGYAMQILEVCSLILVVMIVISLRKITILYKHTIYIYLFTSFQVVQTTIVSSVTILLLYMFPVVLYYCWSVLLND